jgi:hypothetical protein
VLLDWREAGKQVASFAVIIAVTVALAEGILELMLYFPAYLPDAILPAMRKYYYSEDQRFIQYMPDCSKYDPGVTYTLKPGSCRFSGREFDTTVTANSLGVRDDEQSLHAPEIFVLGDSVSMGWGVQDNETYAFLIEKETGIKVLDLAVSSYGTVREFDIASRADASRLNTIILQYSHNDMGENQAFLDNGNHLPISDESTYEATRRQHLEQTKYFFGKHVWWVIRQLADSLIGSANAQEETDEARYFFSVLFIKLADLSNRAKLAPGSTMVIVQGLPWSVETSRAAIAKLEPRPSSISRILEIGYPESHEAYYRLDEHMTAVGHAELARQLIKIIRDKCYLVQDSSDDANECDFFVDEL